MNESTSFEDRLLALLEAEVAQSTAKQSAVKTRSSKRAVRIGALAGAAAVAAVVAVGAPVVWGPDAGSAAWAVETRTDGSVKVTISELRDAAGLERRLAEAGIPAYVTFLPAGMECAGQPGTPLHHGTGFIRAEIAPEQYLEDFERGFIVHAGRIGSNERLALTFARVESAGAQRYNLQFDVVPRNEERCTIVPMT